MPEALSDSCESMSSNAQILCMGTMDLMKACLQTYLTELSAHMERLTDSVKELDKLKNEYANHLRQCNDRTERFQSKNQALQQITDLSSTPENRQRLTDIATSLNQVHHEIRSLKQAIEQKNHTIVQLKENVKTLKSQSTPGPMADPSQVDSNDPRIWPVE